MSIITYPLDNIQYSASDVEGYLSTRTSGVYSSENDFRVSISGERTITISGGRAWIKDGEFNGKSIIVDSEETLNIPIEIYSKRIDRIVLRFSKTENRSFFAVLNGEPSLNPKPPAIVRSGDFYDLGLYDVYTDSKSPYIRLHNITDLRLDESVCGVMRDGVTSIPTAQLQEQAESVLTTLKEKAEEFGFATVSYVSEDTSTVNLPNGVSVVDNQNGIKLYLQYQASVDERYLFIPYASMIFCGKTTKEPSNINIYIFWNTQEGINYDGYQIENKGYDTDYYKEIKFNGEGFDTSDFYTKEEIDEKIGDVETLLGGI